MRGHLWSQRLGGAATVVANALVQALMVAAAPRLPLEPAAIALAAVSGLALYAAATVLWELTLSRATGRTAPRTFILVAVTAGAVAVLAVVAPVLIPVAIALASPVIAAGGLRGAWTLARRHPWLSVGLFLLTLVAVLCAAVVAMLSGLLAPGPTGSALAWLLIGAGAATLIAAWTRLAHRALLASPAADAQP